MPVDWSKYPDDWHQLAKKLRGLVGRCEVAGCPSKAMLTVHHCNHDKYDNTHPALGHGHGNLMVLCARCHLRAHSFEQRLGRYMDRDETLTKLNTAKDRDNLPTMFEVNA